MQRGICVTCARGKLCTYPPAFQGVSQCDEYEEIFAFESRYPRKSIQSAGLMRDAQDDSKGLCTTCAVRSSCAYPRNGVPTLECADYC